MITLTLSAEDWDIIQEALEEDAARYLELATMWAGRSREATYRTCADRSAEVGATVERLRAEARR